MFLLQDQIIEKAMEVSPYNGLAYGFIIVLLLLAVGYLVIELRNERKAYRELSTKMVDLFAKIEIRLTDQEDIVSAQQEIKMLIQQILKELTR